MATIKRYAVLNAETGEVIGQHLISNVERTNPKLNGVKLDYMEFDDNQEQTVVTKTITVNLSSTKGNIDKLLSPIDPPICSKNSFTGNLYIYEK